MVIFINKYIKCLLLIIILDFIVLDNVQAEELEESEVVYDSGFFFKVANDSDNTEQRWEFTSTTATGRLVIISNNYGEGEFMNVMVTDGNTVGELGLEYDAYINGAFERHASAAMPGVYNANLDKTYTTNIPIYDATKEGWHERVLKYGSTGDYSDCDNISDLNLEVDQKIEKPCNLKITGGYNNGIAYSAYSLDKNLDFNWIQTVDTSNYIYDIDVKLTYAILSKNIGASSVTDERVDSGWIDYMEADYNGSSSVAVSINKDFFNNECFVAIAEKYKQIHGKGLALKGFEISRIEARIRNISEGKASDFVVITVDNHSATNNSVTVQDENGNTINDDEYDGTNNANVDFENNTNINGDLSGLSGILNTIRNGFGLLGNNGFISFLSKYFDDIIPSSFWDLIITSFAIVIFVGIINFILKR